MSNVVSRIGAASILAMSLQPDFGDYRKVEHIVEARSGGFDGTIERIYSEANIDSPSPRTGKVLLGNFMGGGDYVSELTPRRASSRQLTGVLGNCTETIHSPDTLSAPTSTLAGVHTGGTVVRKYYIVARNVNGVPSIPSASPATVTTLTTLSGTNKVDIAWSAATGGTGAIASYDVLMSIGSGSTIADAVKLATVTAPTVAYAHTDSTLGSAYNYTSVKVSEKEWKHTWERRFATYVQKKGDGIQVFTDVALSKFDTKISRASEQAEQITMNFSGKPSRMAWLATPKFSSGDRATAMTAAGLDTALYDDMLGFSSSRGIIVITDIATQELLAVAQMEDFGINFDRNTADEYCLNGKPGPCGFRDSVSGLDVTLSAKFIEGAESDLKIFMGQASDLADDSAFGFADDVREVTISCYVSYPSGLGYDSVFKVTLPRAAYGELKVPVGGRTDPLKVPIRCEPIYDGTEATDLIVTMLSPETADSINTAPSTALVMPTDLLA